MARLKRKFKQKSKGAAAVETVETTEQVVNPADPAEPETDGDTAFKDLEHPQDRKAPGALKANTAYPFKRWLPKFKTRPMPRIEFSTEESTESFSQALQRIRKQKYLI